MLAGLAVIAVSLTAAAWLHGSSCRLHPDSTARRAPDLGAAHPPRCGRWVRAEPGHGGRLARPRQAAAAPDYATSPVRQWRATWSGQALMGEASAAALRRGNGGPCEASLIRTIIEFVRRPIGGRARAPERRQDLTAAISVSRRGALRAPAGRGRRSTAATCRRSSSPWWLHRPTARHRRDRIVDGRPGGFASSYLHSRVCRSVAPDGAPVLPANRAGQAPRSHRSQPGGRESTGACPVRQE
jgi:hypothetical protein